MLIQENLNGVSLVVIGLVCGLLLSPTLAQDLEKQQRIKLGKRFLSSSRLNEWERCLKKAPEACGKISFHSARFNFARVAESWFEEPCVLRRNYGDGKQLYSVIIHNPEYTANVDFTNGSPNLIWFLPTSEIPDNFVPDSYFNFTSKIHNNYRSYIFALLKTGGLRIEDYWLENGYHFLELVPETELEEIEYIKLRFDERFLPLPDTRVTKRKGRLAEISISREFVEAGGFWVPTRTHGRALAEGEAISYEAPKEGLNRVTIEPDVKLDKTQCYLEYYGFPEPGIGPIADFGRKSNRLVWIASAVGVISLLGLIFMLWRRGKHNA